MIENLDIRDSTPRDAASIERIYPRAFPQEDLLPLVRALLAEKEPVLSLVAVVEDSVAGHIIFSPGIVGEERTIIALLGPLAVDPAFHGQGAGSALVAAGIARLKGDGAASVCVLGDPAYYSRFGFAAEGGIQPPYELPKEWQAAWQSISLDVAQEFVRGKLLLPEPWMHQELWLP